jgi:hypothetical protein
MFGGPWRMPSESDSGGNIPRDAEKNMGKTLVMSIFFGFLAYFEPNFKEFGVPRIDHL